MKYPAALLGLAAACAAAALRAWDAVGWPAAVLAHAAVSFALLAVVYAGAGPRLLGKRPDGTQSPWARAMFVPYFLLNALSFALYRRRSRGPAFAEVAPNLFFGRRLTKSEAGSVKWVAVLDLAAEFAEVGPLRASPGYRSLPLLDGVAPSESQLRDAAVWLADATLAGPALVHCALGHGRSGSVVMAYLVASGDVRTLGEGLARLRAARPAVGFSAGQRRRLEAFARSARSEREA